MERIHVAIIIIVILLLLHYISRDGFVMSEIDGRYHRVKTNMDDPQRAADMLARVNARIIKLLRSMKARKPNSRVVRNLLERYDPDYLVEGFPRTSWDNVAYTRNKGDLVSLCLRNRKKETLKHQLNTIMFVTLHELSHIGTNVRQHPPEFWETFKFVLQEAVIAGVYDHEHYGDYPVMYCGMEIKYQPLDDTNLDTRE